MKLNIIFIKAVDGQVLHDRKPLDTVQKAMGLWRGQGKPI